MRDKSKNNQWIVMAEWDDLIYAWNMHQDTTRLLTYTDQLWEIMWNYIIGLKSQIRKKFNFKLSILGLKWGRNKFSPVRAQF